MAEATTGKLIIRAISDGKEREQIIDFLCSFAKGTAREAVAARLETLPLTLSSAMPADIANNVLVTLQELGADAVFIQCQTDRPIGQAMTAATTVQQPVSAPVKEPEPPAPTKTARPLTQNRAVQESSVNRDVRVLVILLLVLVASLCGASAIWLPELKAASDPGLLLNKLLQKNADKINKTCPRNLTPQLRLDSYVAGNKGLGKY